jgi:hypothetical protein
MSQRCPALILLDVVFYRDDHIGRIPGYRSRGHCLIPGDTRLSEKYWVWNGVHLASWVQMRSYLKEKVAAAVYKTENTAVGICHADHATPSISKKLALTSSTNGGRSVGIVRSRTQATEFDFYPKMKCFQVYRIYSPHFKSSVTLLALQALGADQDATLLRYC